MCRKIRCAVVPIFSILLATAAQADTVVIAVTEMETDEGALNRCVIGGTITNDLDTATTRALTLTPIFAEGSFTAMVVSPEDAAGTASLNGLAPGDTIALEERLLGVDCDDLDALVITQECYDESCEPPLAGDDAVVSLQIEGREGATGPAANVGPFDGLWTVTSGEMEMLTLTIAQPRPDQLAEVSFVQGADFCDAAPAACDAERVEGKRQDGVSFNEDANEARSLFYFSDTIQSAQFRMEWDPDTGKGQLTTVTGERWDVTVARTQ